MKKNAKISQQIGRRIPTQLQQQVDKEVQKNLRDSQIERVENIQGDVFIRPTVITVKKTSR